MNYVVHCKKEPCDVYIGRGSKWGNRWSHQEGTKAEFIVATRQEAIDAYEAWIRTQPQLIEDLKELKGKKLGCYCKPLNCHGDVLVKLIKEFHGS
jgi:hypothetical protein